MDMGLHFLTVLVPRIQKVMFAPDWNDGLPSPGLDFSGDWVQRAPRLVKVLRLESFEDSLNALELPEERDARLAGQQEIFGDDYLLKYMLDFETKTAGSGSILKPWSIPSTTSCASTVTTDWWRSPWIWWRPSTC